MPITITVDKSGTFFCSNWEGQIKDDELIPAYQAFFDSGQWHSNLDEYADLSKSDFTQVSKQAIDEYGIWMQWFYQNNTEPNRNVRSAVFVKDRDVLIKALFYGVNIGKETEVVKIFKDSDTALRWLREDEVE